ncbi:MAG: hypothetical protein AB1426_04580 [Bacillota bacterium]
MIRKEVRSAQALDCQAIWSGDLNPGQIYGETRVVTLFGAAGQAGTFCAGRGSCAWRGSAGAGVKGCLALPAGVSCWRVPAGKP